ncbi:MAG: hypothetical protein LUI87_14445, partial [Lachnospiraceae bacterium]|nr:hypothetical protein [Lachnospiraceae bacterium]
YYTWRDLSAEPYNCRDGVSSLFRFTVKNLKEHLRRLAMVDSFKRISVLGTNTNDKIYDILTRKIKTPLQEGKKITHQDDIDLEDHAANIAAVVMLCDQKNDDDVIAEFHVEVILSEDDQGRKFAKSLRVEYTDGMVEVVLNNVCPFCGKSFYAEVGKHEEIIICMAGSARVGKTAYLAALVDCIERNGRGFAEVVPSDDPEWTFFRTSILEKYQRGKKIDKTQFEGSGETIPLFSLEIGILGRHYIFTFIDMPGEAFSSDDKDKRLNFVTNDRKIVKYAQMIWFCVAPAQVDIAVKKVSGLTITDKEDRIDTNMAKVMGNIASTMQYVSPGKKKNAAVLITMSDLIMNDEQRSYGDELYLKNVNCFNTYFQNGYFDFNLSRDFMGVSREYLHRAGRVVTSLDQMFARYGTFAVAAYGKQIAGSNAVADLADLASASLTMEDTADEDSMMMDADGSMDLDMSGSLDDLLFDEDPVGTAIEEDDDDDDFTAEPSMVELPFLWTLAALGKIPAKAHVVRTEQRKKFFGLVKTNEEVSELVDVPLDELYV